jgi:hypothetical protein
MAIWLETLSGEKIHMPTTGGDVNSPRDTNIPSTSLIVTKDRCLDGQHQYVLPYVGTVTIDYDPPGRTGSCDQCGQCCGHPEASCPMPPFNCGYVTNPRAPSGWHVCQYLSIAAGANKFGKKSGTECSVRSTIFDISKACTLSPEERKTWMTACSFTFQGE